MNFMDAIMSRFFKPIQPLPAGIYHYQSPPEVGGAYRLHLRLEADGTGLLILNAHTMMHLNQTAAEYCYHLVRQTPQDEALRQISLRYRIDRKQVGIDFEDIKTRIDSLINTPDIDPEIYLGFDRGTLYSAAISAPYRLDCALTSQSRGGGEKSALDVRVKNELTTLQWKSILEKAWAVGIPHVIFTGSEPTLRGDLPELIGFTQEIGQVSGLVTDGLSLVNQATLDSLLDKGLDHTIIVLDPEEENSWEGLRTVLAADIHVTVHLTLGASSKWADVVERLAALGVDTLSLSAVSAEVKDALISAGRLAAEKGMKLVWDLPVPYSHLHLAAMEYVNEEGLPDGAGKAWLYVEPDGNVLLAQGRIENELGNMLSDTWESIWTRARAA